MPKIAYIEKNFGAKSLAVIDRANIFVANFKKEGMTLTLRQMYYQFVKLGEADMERLGFPFCNIAQSRNNKKSYKRLGGIISDGRMAGHVDWNAIVDRTRNLNRLNTYDDPGEIINNCSYSFRIDRWADQPNYIEVWIEKDALIEVIEKPSVNHHVPYYACKGYVSQSEMWTAGYHRLAYQINAGKDAIVIHLGDHDPSGMDMTRDIENRFREFLPRGMNSKFEIHRIALNMDQVVDHKCPPNPAKPSDSRSKDYIRKYGREAWELDALDPLYIRELVDETISIYTDWDAWDKSIEKENEYKDKLRHLSSTWDSDCPECGAER